MVGRLRKDAKAARVDPRGVSGLLDNVEKLVCGEGVCARKGAENAAGA